MTNEESESIGAPRDERLDAAAERGFRNESKPETCTFTIVLDDGKPVTSKVNQSLEQCKADARAAAKDGYEVTDEAGACTYYPAGRIARIVITPEPA